MTGTISSLRFDHIGIEVPDLDAAIQAYTKLFGYRQQTEPVVNSRQQVEVVFLEKAGSLPIKLFRSLGSRQPLRKLHHVAFRTDGIEQAVEAMVKEGARVLHPPAPGEAFDDEPIAFLYAGGLNVELVSTDKRRALLARTD
jgi:methylmalonyl-CoA/ethylmalonyl-CoA epimerase